jgi:hypothetical protein
MHKFVNIEKKFCRYNGAAWHGRAAPQKDFKAVTASAAIFRLHRLPRRHRLVF